MRGSAFNLPVIARAAGYVAVAVLIAATAIQFRHGDTVESRALRTTSTESDPLAHELTRCQAIGMAAKDDAACDAAWAENRRRFFTYGPLPDRATSAAATSNSR